MHAQAVVWGLRQLGHEPVFWPWSSFPERDMASFRIGPQQLPMVRLETSGTAQAGPFDVIWMRRLERPRPMPGAHADDVPVILNESSRFLAGIVPALGHAHTRWVNAPMADQACDRKPYQLAIASRLGFRIPDTLISNDPEEVRAFFTKLGGKMIHKPMGLPFWDNADGSGTASRTSRITAEQLAGDYAIRGCPAIYQELIEKAYELRVTVMGDRVLAAAIDSQRDGVTVDWRCEGGRGMSNLHGTELDGALAQRCVALCRELGLAFGTIDLVVMPHGEPVFLEINCAGQFLFKEVADADLPMLDSFCRFLSEQDAAQGPRLKFADFLNSKEAQQAAHAHRELVLLKQREREEKRAVRQLA